MKTERFCQTLKICEIGDVHWNIGLELAGPVEGTKEAGRNGSDFGAHFKYALCVSDR